MTNDEKKKLYAALAAPFPESCIQRTEGRLTGRGYDTTGIGYQFIINRLNEVLGVGCFRIHREVTVREVQRSNGKPAYEAICDLTMELGSYESGTFVAFAEAVADGGHVSASEPDARKASTSAAIKKAAAFFGVGRQAYEGTLDDDNVPTDAATPPAPAPAHQAPQIPSGYVSTPDVAVRRQPTAPVASPPTGAPATAPAESTRNRVSSKQLGAIWAIARKAGLEQSSLRAQTKLQYGVQLEFLSRQQASELIDALSRKLAANGHADGGAEALNGA